MIYKVSYVVVGGGHPGAIENRETQPEVGELVELGGAKFEVTQVAELIPPLDDLAFLHVVLRKVD